MILDEIFNGSGFNGAGGSRYGYNRRYKRGRNKNYGRNSVGNGFIKAVGPQGIIRGKGYNMGPQGAIRYGGYGHRKKNRGIRRNIRDSGCGDTVYGGVPVGGIGFGANSYGGYPSGGRGGKRNARNNPWIIFFKNFQKRTGMTGKEAMHYASKEYKKLRNR